MSAYVSDTDLAPSPEILPARRTPRPIGRGESSFMLLRKGGKLYVDKSLFLQHVIEDGNKVLLFTRPRRFGKTLNQYLLKAFFGIHREDYTPLFEDLAIWQVPEMRTHFQKYPVLMVTFKDCKSASWEQTLGRIYGIIQALFEEYAYLLDEARLSEVEKLKFRAIWTLEASEAAMQTSLLFLSRLLYRLTGQQAVILIDEYDTPIHSAVENSYYKEAIGFFRGFFSSALKDNEYLFKAVITGILRISREGLFSTLNHIGVHTVFSDGFQSDFGFTEPEVLALLEEYGISDRLDDVRKMYNGYRMGKRHLVDIYNPWSVTSYLMTPEHPLEPYWMNTGSTEMLDQLVVSYGDVMRKPVEALLLGQEIQSGYEDSLTFSELERNPSALFTFLLHAGYLKIKEVEGDWTNQTLTLVVPNQEVSAAYRKLVKGWLAQGLGNRHQGAEDFAKALLTGNLKRVEEDLGTILLTQCSFMDTAGPQPEKFYHGLVLGLLVLLERDYIVQSNPESGYGRVDLLMKPRAPGKAGVVLELKVVETRESHSREGYNTETLDEALLSALEQVEAQQYVAQLEVAGASPLFAYGASFDGKRTRLALLSQKDDVAARVKQAREERARVYQAQGQQLQTNGTGRVRTRPGRARRGGGSSHLALSVPDGLALESAVLPLLTEEGLKQLWVQSRLSLKELPTEQLAIQWGELVTRCEQDGKLAGLFLLLERSFPSLLTQPEWPGLKAKAAT